MSKIYFFLSITLAYDYNVCFIKIRSKHSSNTLVSLLRIVMKQTLRCIQGKFLMRPLQCWAESVLPLGSMINEKSNFHSETLRQSWSVADD